MELSSALCFCFFASLVRSPVRSLFSLISVLSSNFGSVEALAETHRKCAQLAQFRDERQAVKTEKKETREKHDKWENIFFTGSAWKIENIIYIRIDCLSEPDDSERNFEKKIIITRKRFALKQQEKRKKCGNNDASKEGEN